MPGPTDGNTTKKAPPYVPFKTFISSIESLEHGVPNQIDRSVWPSYSGAISGQLIAAFKFLGLIDENGIPQPRLHQLVENKDVRKADVGSILANAYPNIVALNLAKVSPKQLSDAISNYGITGATHRKALAFFLKAARYAGLPLSPLLKRKTRESSGPRKKKNGRSPIKKAQDSNFVSAGAITDSGQGESKTVNLRSGGKLTVILSLKLTEIETEDRNFVFELLDKIRAYEQKTKTASE